MKRVISLLITLIALSALIIPASATTIPTFSITEVVKGQSVTIQTSNFPANDSFTVTMGAFGTQGIGGVVVTTTDSGSGGSFSATYSIPASLAGSDRIAIRLESPTSGFFAYNWFWNTSAEATPLGTPGPTSAPGTTSTSAPSGSSTFPTFSIVAVVKDTSVSISGINFPANDTFTVTMGPMGSKGVGGTKVGDQATGSGGSLTATYSIPSSFAGSTQIAIRLQSPTSGFFAYNWFWNNTAEATPLGTPAPTSAPGTTATPAPTSTPVPSTPAPTTTPGGSTNFPTFSISSVVKDTSVTIAGKNFPANDTFTVTMGPMGTKGVGGTFIGNQDSGSGGSLTATYSIPANLKGSAQIAIRLESPTSGFFAYNFFDNVTTTP